MKRKALMIGVLLAILFVGIINDASARRWACGPHGRAYGYYRPRVWVAPPPPVVVVGPRYGYRPRYYGAPRYYHRAPRYYSYGRPYGHRRW